MMNKVTLCENTFDSSTWETIEVADLRQFLVEHFNGVWPSTAHIYLDHVANNSDITPYDEIGVERLGKIQGHFYVVVYPEGIELILLIVAIAVAAVSIGLSFLLRPHPTVQPQNAGSPNNQLANRQNTARPDGRIPDIFGQLWATFDLLSVPYKIFHNNVETEYCYCCIGRGEYDIATIAGVIQIRDDTTPLAQIDGASAAVYPPHTSPAVGSPSVVIGAPITEPLVNLGVFTGVNGQSLAAPNLGSRLGGMRFRSPNIIEDTLGVDFRFGFQAGDTLFLGGLNPNDDVAVDSGSATSVHLGGEYQISSVSINQILLSGPALINPNWSALAGFSGGVSANSATDNIRGGTPFWTGSAAFTPFFLAHPEVTGIWCNFVAAQGCYKIKNSDGSQSEVDVTLEIGITPCDTAGNPTGGEVLYSTTIIGSHIDKVGKGATLKAVFTPGVGGVLLRASRTSNSDNSGSYSNFDQVQWRDCYLITNVCATGSLDLGNVTTIQTAIKATPAALAVKNRKLNALVTRKVPVPSGSPIAASTNAADIICAMALDPFIGNLQTTDLDIAGIYAIAGPGGAIETYFATLTDPTLFNKFCYTFDNELTSFEESISDVAASIFCVAYRRGGLLSISFEKKTANSTLLFNHRNKIPKTEARTVTFGTALGNDGINLTYIEPNAPNYPNLDTATTLYFPRDNSAVNPKKVTAIGIRNIQQATVLGWRLYWKLIAQNTAVQFECTEEAALCILQDRVLIADNTRSDTQDGEVIAQSVLLLTLSQKVVFVGGLTYAIFLQHYDNTVESIPITAGGLPNQVILGHAPSLPCVVADSMFAKTTYMIVSNATTAQNAFLVAEKSPKAGKTWEVKAVNYDDSYYQHDLDAGVTVQTFLSSPCVPPLYFGQNNSKIRTIQFGIVETLNLTSLDALWIASGFANLRGGVLDKKGNLYVCSEYTSGVVWKIDPILLTVTRIAGSNAGSGSSFGPATAAFLSSNISALAVDSAGNIYIYDAAQFVVFAVNMQATTQTLSGVSIASGNIAIVAGTLINSGFVGDGGPATAARLHPNTAIFPGIAFDSNNNLYIADSSNQRVRKVDTSGIITTFAGNGLYAFGAGHSINNHAGDGGPASASYIGTLGPLIIDANDNLYFMEMSSQSVFGCSAACPGGIGTPVTYSGSFVRDRFNGALNPWISAPESGFDFVPGYFNNFDTVTGSSATQMVSSSGGGGGTSTAGGFVQIGMGPCVRSINLGTGIIDTIVNQQGVRTYGTGSYLTNGDGGPASIARFKGNIFALAVDAFGNLTIIDGTANVIRQVNKTTGIITTIAGNGISGYTGDGGAAISAEINASALLLS